MLILGTLVADDAASVTEARTVALFTQVSLTSTLALCEYTHTATD